MARTLSAAPDLDIGTQTQSMDLLPGEDPFRIVLLGDFGGRANRNEPRLVRDPILIDADTCGDAMNRLGTGLELTVGGIAQSLRFRELWHFHPEHLYQTLPMFEPFRRAQSELANPGAYQTAAASQQGTPAPFRVPASAGPVDPATAAALRTILRNPAFQELEAAWRSIDFLLARIRTGGDLKVYLIDITRQEIAEAIASGAPQLIARENWSVAACLHSFQPNEADLATLAGLAGLARNCGGPFLAGIHPRLVGCPSLSTHPDPAAWNQPLDVAEQQAWNRLRTHPDARWLGLAMPRVLLRHPYGKETSPVDALEFEEMPSPPEHDAYLWGSPALACACLLGKAFQTRGWLLRPGSPDRLDDLPTNRGHSHVISPTEAVVTDSAAETMLERGVMPLRSLEASGSLMLPRFQSVADPPAPLAGPWA